MLFPGKTIESHPEIP